MMKHIKSILTLFVICAIVSVALATVNGITAPIILERQQQAAAGALLEVMPNGGTFDLVDLSSYENIPTTVKEAYKASNGGYVLKIEFKGQNPGNVAMIGVNANGEITGTKCITNTEDAGFGQDWIPVYDSEGRFNGADITTIDGVDHIAGCSNSTKGYRTAVKDALAAATILGGGSYVSPEEMFQNNLNAALGLEGAEFTKHFFKEVVEGVDAIYVEKNGAGHVVVIGGNFIGVANGEVVAGVDAETNAITVSDADKAAAEGAIVTIKATVVTDIDMSAYDFSKRVKSVQVTDAGVYILETEGSGFGKKGDTHSGATGEYLRIRIAIAADGTILDCRTVYLNESTQNGGNYGDAAASEEFYGQFAGKDQSNYEDIEISGATFTTDGYHGAIKNAYKAINIIKEGGAQ